MKQRLFTVLWWTATLGLAYVVVAVSFHLSIYSEPFNDIGLVLLWRKLRPLWIVIGLYLACYIGYGTALRPPRAGSEAN